mmetsp:Transcript_33794/g.95643  ORF Transcript_33794/g.95643 Transcript_33794/m.95643 type:complete len:401 (+) Transcript_33794:208-1410(+)|eukprot:CAMPEP_0117649502 /NCGR_PEP_ID=MMETSP0804-20121206/1006_1 /TAXON_ID=1074897 /ORGANISM="Tetraselmis astigmatica, Strain CCMP880" /LENGTH=400 /DNA_ID=CAMNT_0005455243 /DNA_START=143 /DNA_END=1345 /DNA_ORIENTATION=+
MKKQESVNRRDTNVGLLGSDLEKKIKKAAAEGEPQWEGVGRVPGLQVWRIEQFRVVPWARSKYGQFHEGDSYVVLHTFKKPTTKLEGLPAASQASDQALGWAIHFWIGMHSTADEYGTAAYKAQELDHILSDAATQHRETQGCESQGFKDLFSGGMKILPGGVDTGFNKVRDRGAADVALLKVKGEGGRVLVSFEKPSARSLNSGDVFVLGTPSKIFKWEGSSSNVEEKRVAETVARAMQAERGGRASLSVISEAASPAWASGSDEVEFWAALGGRTGCFGLRSAVRRPDNNDPKHAAKKGFPCLYRLSDRGWFSGGKLVFAKVPVPPVSKLRPEDVYILDSGCEVFVWVGSKASEQEKSRSFFFVHQYIRDNRRPTFLPLTRLNQGTESPAFTAALKAH